MDGRGQTPRGRPRAQITVKELLARFWHHAEGYYRTVTDGRNKELEQFKLALRPLRELYGEAPAIEFGPRALEGTVDECRDDIVSLLEGGEEAFMKRKERYRF